MNFGPMANSFFIALSHSCYMFLSEKKKRKEKHYKQLGEKFW